MGEPAHEVQALGLSDRETQAVSQYRAAIGRGTDAGRQASAEAQDEQAPRSVPTLACWQGVGDFQATWQGQDARFILNLMPMRAAPPTPTPCAHRSTA